MRVTLEKTSKGIRFISTPRPYWKPFPSKEETLLVPGARCLPEATVAPSSEETWPEQSLWQRGSNPQHSGPGSCTERQHSHTTNTSIKETKLQDHELITRTNQNSEHCHHQLAETPAISTKYVTVDSILLTVARKTLEFWSVNLLTTNTHDL